MATALKMRESARPEHYDALVQLLAADIEAQWVERVYCAGDLMAERDRHGVPRETFLYVTKPKDGRQECWTALLLPDGVIETRPGW